MLDTSTRSEVSVVSTDFDYLSFGASPKEVNILEYMKNKGSFPLDFIKITDDNTSIITFNGAHRKVYTAIKTYLEVLAREIFVRTFLKDESHYYMEEQSEIDGCRSDLVVAPFGKEGGKQIIVEFKALGVDASPSMFKNVVDGAFLQVKNKYIKEKDGELFVTIVVMDVKKIIDQPSNLEKFIISPDREKTASGLTKNVDNKLFKKYGISIYTKKYDPKTENYTSEMWFHMPKQCKVEIDRNVIDIFGQSQMVAEIQDAIHFPTVSSPFGVKNVRDIKNPEIDDAKKTLLLEIFKTVLDGFKTKDRSLINKYGKEKDFVYINEQSIIKKIVFKNVEYYSLVTMNGAIVDGQNSIHCFKVILDFIDSQIENKKQKNLPKYYEKMEKVVRAVFEGDISLDEYKKLKQFVEQMKITIKCSNTENEKEATRVATNKNNTMAVTANELTASKFGDCIQVVSSEMMRTYDLLLGHPKKTYYGVSEEDIKNKMINCYELAKITSVLVEIIGVGFEPSQLFAYRSKLVKSVATKYLEQFCSTYTEAITDENSENVKKIESKILEVSNDISNAKLLKKAFEDAELFAQVEKREEEIELKSAMLKDLQEERKMALIQTYKPKNIEMLANIHQTVLSVKGMVKNISDILPGGKQKNIKIPQDETMFYYCFLLLIRKYKDHDFSKCSIKNSDIKKVVIRFFENFYHFVSTYQNINITSLNHNNGDAKTTDINGVVVSHKDIIANLCSV